MSKGNADGAVNRSGTKGAAAAIFWNEEGLFLGASAIVISGLSDPGTLEALACREALTLSHDLQIRRVSIASDCSWLVRDIAEGNRGNYGTVINEICKRKLDLEGVEFKHEMRESNWEAHDIAKGALGLGVGWHVCLVHPPNFVNIPVILE